jgi:hypothetical protein
MGQRHRFIPNPLRLSLFKASRFGDRLTTDVGLENFTHLLVPQTPLVPDPNPLPAVEGTNYLSFEGADRGRSIPRGQAGYAQALVQQLAFGGRQGPPEGVVISPWHPLSSSPRSCIAVVTTGRWHDQPWL